MSLKLKVILLEIVQLLGLISVICALPNVANLAPWVGIAGGIATASATYIKQQIDAPQASVPSTPPSDTK
jgi:hypothetical protein